MRIAGKKITAIVSDFDGTIIKHGMMAPTHRFYDLVNECLDNGIFFVAASGRQYANLHRLLKDLKKEIAYISENGSLVIYQGEVIYKAVIEEQLTAELLADMQQEAVDILVSGQKTAYVLDKNPQFIQHMIQVVGNDITVVKDFKEVTEPVIKIAMAFQNGIPEEVASRYHAKYDDRLQVVDAGNNWFDFNPLESSKGKAMLVLAEKLGINLSETIVFGDGENDIAMLKEGAVAFVMDTAKSNVKEHAHYICESVEDVIRYGLDQEKELEKYALALAAAVGKSPQEGADFWNVLVKDEEILEEFDYFYTNRDFLCKHKVAGYSVADILVWQVDHFKAYLDRHLEVNRYDRDKLVFHSFEVLLQMRINPKFYTDKLEGETGTDFEGKY